MYSNFLPSNVSIFSNLPPPSLGAIPNFRPLLYSSIYVTTRFVIELIATKSVLVSLRFRYSFCNHTIITCNLNVFSRFDRRRSRFTISLPWKNTYCVQTTKIRNPSEPIKFNERLMEILLIFIFTITLFLMKSHCDSIRWNLRQSALILIRKDFILR